MAADISPISSEVRDGLVLTDDELVLTGTFREGRPEFRISRDVWFRDVRVPAGYVTDKHSLPGLVRAWQPKGAQWAGPPIIHDYLYETMEKPKAAADQLYADAMMAIGVKVHHRIIAYLAVKRFGHGGFGKVDADNVDLIRINPKAKPMDRKSSGLKRRVAKFALMRAGSWYLQKRIGL